jgi:glutamyl-Q tRNA(Asp) synthetase
VALDLCYPCRCTRSDIRAALTAPQEGAPGSDGPAYPGTCRHRKMSECGEDDAIRLYMAKALARIGDAGFAENGPLRVGYHPIDRDLLMAGFGDVVLSRRDIGPGAYHLAVTVDDAEQRITEALRGVDLFEATHLHVLLQKLLELPTPDYWHHDLIRDENGKRLAKRDDARALARFRAEGATPTDIRRMVGL